MLRDPIEQVLSYYSFSPVIARSPWAPRIPAPGPHAPILRLGKEIDIQRPLTMPIDAYFAQPSDQIAAIFDNMQTRYIASKDELVWASSVVDGFGGTLPSDAMGELGPNLAEAKRRLDRFAFVGITERFRAWWRSSPIPSIGNRFGMCQYATSPRGASTAITLRRAPSRVSAKSTRWIMRSMGTRDAYSTSGITQWKMT